MKKYNVLILTDHTNHSKENSLYPLVRAMLKHPLCNKIDVASRANQDNKAFFAKDKDSFLSVSQTNADFAYSENGEYLNHNLRTVEPDSYDLVWLRMPPPLEQDFLIFLEEVFKEQVVINNPRGIFTTGSKAFLERFPDLCPAMKICNTKEDIIAFKKEFPIILKPFREYGGKGIVKIDGNDVWLGKEKMTFDDFINQLDSENDLEYLGVKFLEKVTEGDKRIIVVNGKIMGASLRLPPKDSWICNVAMGGSSHIAEVDDDERHIIDTINPILNTMGIVMYGVDTLMGDKGKRILSEINTTSIGGLPQIANQRNLPLVDEAIDLIWSYFLKNKQHEN